MDKIIIYLSDLFYSQNAKFHGVPLNIGHIGNALKVTYGDKAEIELFKYPEELLAALKKKKPQVLGLSNYVWNQRLSLKFARLAKSISREIITVMGGPHIRTDESGLKEFLARHQEIDCYIPHVGEFPFIRLVQAVSDAASADINEIFKNSGSITGAVLNVHNYDYRPENQESWKEVYKFGSPYLNGYLDKFIKDPKIMPIFETNRGCPFHCSYCAFSVGKTRRVYLKDNDTVIKEFNYVAKNGAGQKHWYIADANFGAFKRDIEFARELKALREKYGTPMVCLGTSAKGEFYNNVVEINKISNEIFGPNVAVQSFDPVVLANIGRKNLSEEKIKELVAMNKAYGVDTYTDVIMGLSGETFDSHVLTLKKAMDLDLNFSVQTLALLPGTLMDSQEQREKYGFQVKYRFGADVYGVYDDEFIFEIDEVVCVTNAMSYDEFLDLRCLDLLVYMLWTTKIGRKLLDFGKAFYNQHQIDAILEILRKPKRTIIKNLLSGLRRKMRSQFFDTKGELIDHYRDKNRVAAILNSGNETKLFWEYFTGLIIKKENIAELIDELSDKLSAVEDMNLNLLAVLRKISLDQLMLVFDQSLPLIKTLKYELAYDDYQSLLSKDLLPETVEYENGAINLKFEYEQEKRKYFLNILEQAKYKENPRRAINTALNLALGTNSLYKIS